MHEAGKASFDELKEGVQTWHDGLGAKGRRVIESDYGGAGSGWLPAFGTVILC